MDLSMSKGDLLTLSQGKFTSAFWTAYYMFRLRVHFKPLSLGQTTAEILKTFLTANSDKGARNPTATEKNIKCTCLKSWLNSK